MGLPLTAFRNPAADRVNLFVRDCSICRRRGHPASRLGMAHSLENQTLRRLARDDQASAPCLREGAFPGVQPDTRHALLFIRAVALEAVLRQDGSDIPIEVDLRAQGGSEKHNEGITTQHGPFIIQRTGARRAPHLLPDP